MFGKIFNQIFDSSLANDYQLRHFFMDLIVLADIEGNVDMTQEAISARTRIPLDDVIRLLAELEKPDPRSRSTKADGKRIIRLDDHRDWGWKIINYQHYRLIASDQQRRERGRDRTRKWRESKGVQIGDAPVTLCNARDARQRQRQRQKHSTPLTPLRGDGVVAGREEFEEFWAVYPRKVAKAAALKIWQRLKLHQIMPQILAAIEAQKKTDQWKRDGGQFIPHPSTWLNQGRWEDDPKTYGTATSNRNGKVVGGNPRNDGTYPPLVDYGEAARRKQLRQADDERQRRLEAPVALQQAFPSQISP